MLAAYIVQAENIKSFADVFTKYTGDKLPELCSPQLLFQKYIELESELLGQLKEKNGLDVFNNIELPLVPALYEMEKNGILIDANILSQQSQELGKDLEELEKAIFDLSGESFNISSPKQLGVILFEKLGLPTSKKTKTGYSTNSDVLMGLRNQHPICDLILQYREDSKLKSTYVDALPKLINPETGRVHTQFRQAVTTTGRLSSVNPNLQNIPVRTEKGRMIRKAFVTDEGYEFLSADYSQIELRVLAHITNDPGLLKAFELDLDVHAMTASEIYNVKLEDVTTEQRRNAKAVNFGIAYGQGAYGLAESLGISRSEGKEIIDTYFKKFKKVREYIESTTEKAKADGYVEMLSGRRRYIHEFESKMPAIRKFGERAAINAPMQGTASDIVKLAMIEAYKSIESRMLLQVHDELIFSCHESIVDDELKDIVSIMENCFSLKVPLKVNASTGKNWDEAH
ncbi:MAG: DNA polymerase [Bdellovibrionales bacterium]